MADYTIVEGAGVSSTGASLSVPVPAGTLTGKLLLLVAAVRDYGGAVVTTAPSGFTLLESYSPGANPSLWVYGKIGTASESSVSFDTSTGVSQAAFMISVESTTGWPAIGSVEAGSSSGDYDGGSGNLGLIARTITTSGNFVLQVGKKASVSGTNTVAVTSGWASAGRALENGTSNTLNLAGQSKKVTANVPSVGVAITGEATSSVAGCITIELIPAAAAPSFVATPANPYPGQTVNLALSNFASAPLSANCLFGGVPITLEAGATNSAASFIMPGRSAFRFGGGHATKRFNVNHVLTIANTTESATANMQVVPQQPGGFGVRSAVAQSNTPMGDVINLGPWNSGAIVLATGDEVRGHIVSGDGVINAPEVNYDAYSSPLVMEFDYYDVSAGSWSGLTTVTYMDSFSMASAYGDDLVTAFGAWALSQHSSTVVAQDNEDIVIVGEFVNLNSFNAQVSETGHVSASVLAHLSLAASPIYSGDSPDVQASVSLWYSGITLRDDSEFPYDEWLPYLLPWLPQCPRALVLQQLEEVITKFCEQTRQWLFIAEPMDVRIDQEVYSLTLPGKVEVVKAEIVLLEGRQIFAEEQSPSMMSTGGVARYTRYRNRILLAPIPNADIPGGLEVSLSLKPTAGRGSSHKSLFDNWREGICAGVIGRLWNSVGQPWSAKADAVQAQFFKFDTTVNAALADRLGYSDGRSGRMSGVSVFKARRR